VTPSVIAYTAPESPECRRLHAARECSWCNEEQ